MSAVLFVLEISKAERGRGSAGSGRLEHLKIYRAGIIRKRDTEMSVAGIEEL